MSIIELRNSKLSSVVYRTIDCRTNDNLINIVNPKIDRMLSLIEQVQKLSSQLTAKFDKLPKDFQTPGMTEYSQRLKRTAEAAIVTASTVLESQSTIVGGEAGQQPPSSSSGELSEDQRKHKIEEWISNLTVSHGEREQEYDSLSELTPDDSVSSMGMNKNTRSQQINEARIPGSSSAADMSAGTPKTTSMGRANSIQNVFEKGFAHSSQDQEISSSSEESYFDAISENSLTDYRADRKVDTSYDEESVKELLAVLGAKFDATKWKANELLLDLAKMEVGCGVRSNSNIVGTVLYLLEKGADVNAMNAESQTPLYCASEVGNTAVVELLVKKNADFNIKDRGGWTALHVAASMGRTPVVEILLKSGVDVEQETKPYQCTALAVAASYGRTSTVECLLKAGASIDASDNEAWTSLLWASSLGHVGVAETLLKAGASIDARINDDRTALIGASSKGHVGVVEALLKAGAALDLQTNIGWTALMCSAYWGHKAIAELLLAAGADIRARSKDGDTVLHWVLRKHLENCAKNNNCAFCAGSETRQDMVKLLCEKGVDPSAKGWSGQSPLSIVYEEDIYSKSEQEALTKVLKKFGAKSPGSRR